MSKKGQYTFILSGLKYKDLIKEYYDPSPHNVVSNSSVTTLLPTPQTGVFADIKNKVKTYMTMVDVHQQKCLPLTTNKPCWWCGYEFDTLPLGIPLHYHSHVDKCNTEIQKFLTIRNFQSTTNDFFETDGLFCSFPCCKAYLVANGFKGKYKNSFSLLTLLHIKLYGEINIIPSAPPRELLEKWGGPLTIEEYRSKFGQYQYFRTPNIKRPFMFSISSIIEEIKTV